MDSVGKWAWDQKYDEFLEVVNKGFILLYGIGRGEAWACASKKTTTGITIIIAKKREVKHLKGIKSVSVYAPSSVCIPLPSVVLDLSSSPCIFE